MFFQSPAEYTDFYLPPFIVWDGASSWFVSYCWILLFGFAGGHTFALNYNIMGLPFASLAGKESACSARDLGSIPGLWRSPGERIGYPLQYSWAFLVAQTVKKSTCKAGDLGLILGLGRSPEGGHDNPLQYSCLENSMDRGAWWAAVHGVTKSWTWLRNYIQCNRMAGYSTFFYMSFKFFTLFIKKNKPAYPCS